MPNGQDGTRLSSSTRLGALKDEDVYPEHVPTLHCGIQFSLFIEDFIVA